MSRGEWSQGGLLVPGRGSGAMAAHSWWANTLLSERRFHHRRPPWVEWGACTFFRCGLHIGRGRLPVSACGRPDLSGPNRATALPTALRQSPANIARTSHN